MIVRLAHDHMRYIPSNLLDLSDTCNPYDIEKNMKIMDKLYNASFFEYIKSEDNVLTIARHLMPLIKEYNVQTVANGLRWTIDGWRLENVAKLLKLITRDFIPDVCGLLINMITVGWDVRDAEMLFGDDSSNHPARNSIISFPKETLVNFIAKLPSLLSTETAKTITRSSNNALMKLIAILVSGEQ